MHGTDIITQALIASSPAVRREYEGPAYAEWTRSASPRGGWQDIRDKSVENQLRGGYTRAQLAAPCPRCHLVKSVIGTCGC